MQNVFRVALLCEESVFAANVFFAYVLTQDNVIHENTATISLGTMLPIFACGPLVCFFDVVVVVLFARLYFHVSSHNHLHRLFFGQSCCMGFWQLRTHTECRAGQSLQGHTPLSIVYC